MRMPTALALAAALLVPQGAAAEITNAPKSETKRPIKAETVAKGLVHPWGLAFLPDGRLLVTERPGRLRIIAKDGRLSAPVDGVPSVVAHGQGGLLDVALSPDFDSSSVIYFSYAEPREGGKNGTTVTRARLVMGEDGGRLDDIRVIFRQQPSYASNNHFGSRIVFMPDGSLFVTMGERYYARDEAQNPANHIGKLVRLMPDGSPYPGNPKRDGWRPEVWSIGHRNVQGAALHPGSGKLWTVEHGARGGDEINIPEAGRNYGWPVISYGRNYPGPWVSDVQWRSSMEQPLIFWMPSIAASGIVFYTGDRFPAWKGNVFVGGMRTGEIDRTGRIERIVFNEKGDEMRRESLLTELKKRFRDVRQGPDGLLYALVDDEMVANVGEGAVLRIEPVN
jgi:glucose/arabinose dehydrogenase